MANLHHRRFRARVRQSGAALAGFTVAVSHRSKHNGQWPDVTDGFFRCTAWRQAADNAGHSFRKGSRVMVSGRLVQRTFEAEDGQRRTAIEVQVQHLGADVQFAAVEIKKAQAGEGSASDGPSAASSAKEKSP